LPNLCTDTILEAHKVIDIVPTQISIIINMQLKSDILNEAVGSLSVVTSSDDPNNLEESSDPLHPIEAPPANMLDILLNGIGSMTTPNDQVNTATANQVCEN
jgi:hypothetical protein